MFHTDDERAAETARLNDLARTNPQMVNAAWFTTRGVAALVGDDPEKRRALVEAVAGFSDFSEDNNPFGERDFGAFTLWGASGCSGRSTITIWSETSTRRSSGAPPRPPVAPPVPAVEGPGLVTDMARLGVHACKWPIGDPKSPDFSFCGRHADGRYCAAHETQGVRAGTAWRADRDPVVRRALAGLI